MQIETVKPYPKYPISMYKEHDHVVHGVPSGWEASTLWIWLKTLESMEGVTVLDIGAYTGIYGLLAAKYGKDVDVIAFEPLKATYTRLQANIGLNALSDTMKAFPVALSDSSGSVELNVTGDNPLPSGSSVDPHPSKANVRVETIQLTTGNDFFTFKHTLKKKVGLIKMDVERHELNALRGLTDILVSDKPVCIIELLTPEEAVAVFDFMRAIGYTKIYQINDAPVISDKLYKEVTDNLVITSSKTNFMFKE